VPNKHSRPVTRRRLALKAAAAVSIVLIIAVGLLVADEARTSAFQARYFSGIADKVRFWLEPGPSPSIRFPQSGPYDQRLGYSELPLFLERLRAKGYRIESQARASPEFIELMEDGYFPPYPEKSQAGLRVLDCGGEPLF